MKNLNDIIKCKKAKTKKSFGGIAGFVIAIIIGVTVFSGGGGGALIGILFGAGILATVTAGVYFWLKAIDELPDSF